MIPLKLTLQNFLCYRDDNHTLDLTGIRVACLCGNNGHGKSALLDSITWALWGKARGSSHSDLIHYGRSHMSVELEFQAADAHYRVTRRFRDPRGSDLQLHLKSPSGFFPITGNSIRESQAKINHVIGMDYDTFINSAFLIQGRADEFTNKTPAERKEVLGKILGLDRFNLLQQRSRDRARNRRETANFLEGEIEFKRHETAAKPELQQKLQSTLQCLQNVSHNLDQRNLQANELRTEIQHLQLRIAESQELRRRIPHLQSEISRYDSEIRQRTSRLGEFQSLLNRRSSIEEGHAQYQRATEENQRLNAARTQFDELTRRINELQQSIAHEKARLEEQLRTQKRRLQSDLEPAIDAIPDLERRLAEAAATLESLAHDEKSLQQESARLQQISVQSHTLAETQSRLEAEGRRLADKLKLLNSSHQDARCPLCDASLGEEGCLRLATGYQHEIREKRQQYSQNQHTLKDLHAQQQDLTDQIHRSQNSLQRRKHESLQQTALLQRQLEDSRRAREQAESLRPEIQRLEDLILNDQFAPDPQAELSSTQASLQTLDYSPDRHSQLAQQLQELQPFQFLSQQLAEAGRSLPQEQEDLAQTQQAAQDRRHRLSQIRESLATIESDHAHLDSITPQLSRITTEIADLESQQQDFIAQQGRLQGSVQRIEELERQITRQSNELRILRDEQAVYEELRLAFGREGVQALLIDTILPQIEQEANSLLARMTEGRMTLNLESQRPLRSQKGQFAETLEIKVSDELGHRSYEMFSGGEAFRINLALRIALSKVLANRTGAPLPTLFIDEGFGTQDSAGREQILDVLSTLEQDFKCIIVITHLEELKDYFPVRIEVQNQNCAPTARIT